jgi:hypothetical protein
MRTCHKCKIDMDEYEIFTYMSQVIYLCLDCSVGIMNFIDGEVEG